MKNFKGWKKKTFMGIGVLVLALLFCFNLNQKEDVNAANDVIIIGSNDSKDDFTLTTPSITMYYTPSTTITGTAEWTTDDDTIVSIEEASKNQLSTKLIAKGVGDTDVYLKVNGNVIASRHVIIKSAIVQNPILFKVEETISEDAIMILDLDQDYSSTDKYLQLMFSATNITWSSKSEEVVKVDSNGKVTPVGTGFTTISVSYNVSDGSLKESQVEVYVGPKVSSDAGSSNPIKIDTGKYLYPGINCDKQEQTLTEKIEWVVKDENQTVISSSANGNLDILKFDGGGFNPYWIVDAKAGTYYLTVATKGCLESGNSMLVKNYTLQVYATTPDDTVITHSLQVGDSYDIATDFNIASKDFSKYFTYDTYPSDAELYYKYNPNTGTVTAVGKTNNVEFTIKAKDTTYLKDPTIDTYTIRLTIYQGFSLNHSAVRLPLNSELSLTTVYSESKGIVKWTSSAPNTVSVDEAGNIKALQVTGDNSVTITATMTMEDGRVLQATCSVVVDNTATGITLSKEELEIEVEQVATLKANLAPSTVTSADLQWLISDESIIAVDVQPDTLSATITGLKPGTAVVTVVNEDNYVAGYCMITVKSPITDITIESELTLYEYYKKYKFEATYKPVDATSTALEWYSSDKNVAYFEDYTDSLITLKGGGTTIITVRPKYNPNGVYAQCTLTVIESADSFSIKQSSVTVEAGEKVELEYEVKSDAATTTITWESMNKSIATVSDKGVVKGVSAGQTYIIAKTSEGYVDYCLVTVTQKASGVSLDVYTLNLAVGESYTVTATPKPADATEVEFTWSSKDKNIATVDNTGKITGVEAGSTVILVKTSTGGVEYVYVTVYSKATGMSLNYDNVTLVKGDTLKLKPIFTPADVTNKKVKYTSSNEKVVSVAEDGTLTGVKGGVAIVTAVSDDGGHTAICLVVVQERVTSLTLNKSSYIIGVGKTATLKATVESNSSSNPKLKWSTSNSKIVSVNQSGKIRGKKIGTATITVKVTDGTGLKATCKVRVVKAATKVSLNTRMLTVVVGQTEKLKATITPTDATIKSVKWTSADSTIAEVQNGEVLGLSVGTTKITATAKDNSGKKATCYVNVIEEVPATSIVLSAQNLTLIKGQSQKIGYSVVPSNNTDKVYFDSDNRAVATVNGSGKVNARRAGVANITITTSSGKQVVVKVTVIGLNKTKITMEQYDTETLFVDGVTSGITWFTSNPSIATVQNGKITARKAGTCTIYAKVNGVNLSCTVVVKKIN